MAIKAIMWLLLVAGGLLILSPLVDWARNPVLTQMQLFIEHWGRFAGGVVLCVSGMAIASKMDQKNKRGSQ